MDFDLDRAQQAMQKTARTMLAARSGLDKVRAAAESGEYDPALVREIDELGWPAVALPEAHGGLGQGIVDLAVLAEQLGYALAGTPVLASAITALALTELGDQNQRDTLVTGLAEATMHGAIGHAPAGARTVLVPDAQGAEVIVLLVGEQARILTADAITLEPTQTVDPTRRYARIPADAGEALSGDTRKVVDIGATLMAAELIGLARRALDLSVAYAKERQQFGVPIGSFQAVAHKCALMLRQVETSASVLYAAAWAIDADAPGRSEQAAMAKALASETGREVTAAAIQVHGGIGMTWAADLHWFFKRAQMDAQLFGSPSAHRAALATALFG